MPQRAGRIGGSRILIEGQTARIASITCGIANGDGVIDHSVISLCSGQGADGSAHVDDRLDTFTLYGDPVNRADTELTAAPAHGIVEGVKDIREAAVPIAP